MDEKRQQQERHTDTASALQNAQEIDARERREAELRERERQHAEAEAAYQAREEYAKTLAEEKVDLIRAKQGLLGDEAFQTEEEEKHYTVLQKIGNWIYHSKWWLGIAVFIVLVGAFLIYDYATRVDADFNFLMLTDNAGFLTEEETLQNWFTPMIEDYNGDGQVRAGVIYIPVSETALELSGTYSAAYNNQLLIQFQTATCMLVLTDEQAEAYLQPEDMFADMERLYPDCPFTDGWRLRLDGTNFAELAGLETPLNPGSCLALRLVTENMDSEEKNQKARDIAKAVLDRIVPQLRKTDTAESQEQEGR